MLEGMDALLLSGGGDVDPRLYGGDPDVAELVNRKRDDFEIALIREARRREIPILGICRGCQILNVALGGQLVDLDSDEELRKTHFSTSGHPVEVEEGSLLSRLMRAGRIDNVPSYHGQAVGRLGEGVRAAARSSDGTVEAIEIAGEWTLAVQWHPEMTVSDQLQFDLVSAFVEEARRRRTARPSSGTPGDPK
jgi:gamma-glutamyl-gamma-aminobutyrate hydrolase PuuD